MSNKSIFLFKHLGNICSVVATDNENYPMLFTNLKVIDLKIEDCDHDDPAHDDATTKHVLHHLYEYKNARTKQIDCYEQVEYHNYMNQAACVGTENWNNTVFLKRSYNVARSF